MSKRKERDLFRIANKGVWERMSAELKFKPKIIGFVCHW